MAEQVERLKDKPDSAAAQTSSCVVSQLAGVDAVKEVLARSWFVEQT